MFVLIIITLVSVILLISAITPFILSVIPNDTLSIIIGIVYFLLGCFFLALCLAYIM